MQNNFSALLTGMVIGAICAFFWSSVGLTIWLWVNAGVCGR